MPSWFLSLKRVVTLKRFLITILLSSVLINFVGAFGPELGFDALWYHLTLPKLWLMMGKITFIPGGLLYYSAMPRLGEFLFLFPLKFFGEVGPHLLNWVFGVAAAVVTYRLARRFVSKELSVLAAAIFYVTPLVGWQSGSGYVDLIRTFFEVTAFFLLFEKKHLLAGLAIGLAVSTKTLALGSVPILVSLALFLDRDWKSSLKLIAGAAVLAAPWFIYSFIKTGFPFYPVGAGILDASHHLFPGLGNPWSLIGDYYRIFLAPDDYLSPVFVVFVPLLFIVARKFNRQEIAVFICCLISYLVWWATPRTGGGRFILPYVPVWSVLVVVALSHLRDKFVIGTLLAVTVIGIGANLIFRAGAVTRLLPLLTGQESKTGYLCRHLDFKTSVFVDCDGWFAKNLKKTDLVLTSRVHNLFYVNFPFVDATWYNDEAYTHILVPIGVDPQSVNFLGRSLKLIHRDERVGVDLYRAQDLQYALK